MISGNLKDLKNFVDIDIVNIINTFIKEVRFGNVDLNQWKYFDGIDYLKAIPLNKSNKQDDVKEYHKEYTDIHITISGTDTIFIGNVVTEVIEEYQVLNDYSLVNSVTEISEKIFPDNFVIIKPKTLHCNILEGQDPLKIVIKIKEKCQK